MQEARKPNAALIAIIVIVLLAAAAGGTFYVMNQKKDAGSSSTTDTPASTSDDTSSSTTSSSSHESYKDGTYSATGSYISPGGQESVDVQVTLKSGVVEEATVSPHPASSTSTQYQGEFVANFKPLVVGKSINDIKLSRVAGSSLTSGGFNQAIEKIKDEAAS
ncbi:MAG TPA: hypothetical protein VJ841_00950 [Candidatus Saccharimonadales bacterium]|nr:hypothetical protein [Candidatus Saccharimonadales bacterium]